RAQEYSKTQQLASVSKFKLSSARIASNGQTVLLREIRLMRKYFDDLDEDGDGTVDMDEIKEHMTKMLGGKSGNSSSCNMTFINSLKDYCQAGNELTFQAMLKINYPLATWKEVNTMAELIVPAKAREKAKGPSYSEEDVLDVDKMWCMWDKDGSGELDRDEFRAVLMDLGVPTEELGDIYSQVDTDDNGFISADEFKVTVLWRLLLCSNLGRFLCRFVQEENVPRLS
ncbi:hypothetical protein CYMTET_47073, partial [Cymbomonas tetramitiformis]